jgi:hypothetical protein
MRLTIALFGLFLYAAPCAASPDPPTPACAARSGAGTVTLVELYTSEGCSSCPPADRWLGSLHEAVRSGRLVPLAFHVDYWDHLGWRDRFASPRFGERQRERTAAAGGRVVYTPQVFLDGRDFRAWRNGAAVEQAVRAVGRRPAAAWLDLALRVESERAWRVELEVRVDRPASGLQAYLAVYENGLHSTVNAGENAGRQLRHDFVVREWIGPLAVPGDGRLRHTRRILLREPVDTAQAGLVAFIENPAGGEVLQALLLPYCAPA